MGTISSSPFTTRHGPAAPGAPASCRPPGRAVFVHAFCLPAVPAEVPGARRRAARVLREWGLREDGLHTAQLVISELVGNAVRHAVPHTTRATVRLTRTSATLTLTVHDGHPALPRLRFATDPEQDGGRGLMIVDCLAREAGGALQIRRTPSRGKEVRAIFRAADCAHGHATACPAGLCPYMQFDVERRAR
ncbi:ATP-binding protein [Streptomyces chengbuensis]|uniref:ATP-binding protein n=1 Tax=Streptomyces chengbuensis TaxID=3053466 RepID=UPI0025B2C135|nr:ATP-binding protein [Streptomyces sp. HUAS CB01]WJY48703.1 ATP-binding protein [Streptomyces sp. HUAS CB01]